MFLPYRSKNPPESFPFATVGLIVINVLVYALTAFDGLHIRQAVVDDYAVSYEHFTLWRSFTSMFLHADPLHLIGNMWFLYLFGFAVEGRLRSLKFLGVYFVAGFAGDALQMFIQGAEHPSVYSFGASGAIMGTLGAALFMFPFAEVDFVYWFGIWFYGTTTLAMYWVAAYSLGKDILFGFAFAGADGVGHFAHLGGALGGLIACALMFPRRDNKAVAEAKADLADVQDQSMLMSRDLAHLASVNPNDTKLALNWMERCVDENKVTPECRDSFRRLFPEIMRKEPAGHLASVMLGMVMVGETVNADVLLNIGSKLEIAGEPSLALRLYETVLQMPGLSADRREQTLFRSAMVLETKLRQPDAARPRYQEVITMSPMSPLADQSKIRLSAIDSGAGARQ